jgi:2-methylcitrate dehydratase PrpD
VSPPAPPARPAGPAGAHGTESPGGAGGAGDTGDTVGRLVGWVAGVRPDPASAHAATRALLDWFGCAAAGATHPAATAVAAGLDGLLGTSAACTVVAADRRSSPYGAALVNGTASHVLDFDDVNVAMIGHPGVVVVPAALALAEAAGADGPTLLAGIVAGYEVAARLGAAVNPGHYEAGWHATATVGCAAAAAAVARVLGLDEPATGRALALGVTQAGGVREVFGSPGKAFHAGRAAAAGVLAATLARSGASAPLSTLDGPAGWLAAASGPGGPGAVPAPGTPHPAILDTAVKGHAACGATHCLADAVAAAAAGLRPDEIASIEATVHPLAVRAAGQRAPVTGLAAKFSLWHVAALAVTTHPLGPGSFTDAATVHPGTVRLRERVRIDVDESFRYAEAMPAAVTLRTTDGRVLRAYVDTPRGRPGNPMSDPELESKALELATPVLGAVRARRAVAAIWSVAGAADVRTLARALAAG